MPRENWAYQKKKRKKQPAEKFHKCVSIYSNIAPDMFETSVNQYLYWIQQINVDLKQLTTSDHSSQNH